jgi:putative transposase
MPWRKERNINTYIFQGMKRDKALSIAGVSKHQYYYRPNKNSRGRKPSSVTPRIEGDNVQYCTNKQVVDQIKKVQSDPDTDYGYRKMNYALLILGYIINHKKVYRLMFENQLLKDKKTKVLRNYVKYRKVLPSAPFQLLEMDIKFVWVEEHRRHAFILTVIDTFTRMVLKWEAAYQIKQGQVKQLWEHIIETFLQPYDCLGRKMNIEIRNDNDSRFLAKTVQQFFAENKINQVFIHPYTPQENGHIESFHAILSEKLNRYKFWSLYDLDQCLTLFYEKYNNQRLHSSVCYLSPTVFLDCWEKGLIDTQVDEKKRKISHRLKIPYNQLSGNMNLREVPCYNPKTLDGFEDYKTIKEMYGAETFQQPSV